MKQYKVSVVICLALSFAPLLAGLSSAGEPMRPDVDSVFGFEKEVKISELALLPSDEAFRRLKDVEFLSHEQLLHKAIFKVYGQRRAEGIALALNYITLPVMQTIEGQMVGRVDDFIVAKRILEVFPDESVPRILELYKRSDAVTRGNIIRASGKIAGGDPINNLLLSALDDKTFCEEESPEAVGEPLRICDVAYNQLVQRYQVKNVLRTIGPIYRIEVRDYHIDILKTKL
jgi:hypothetical protein